MLPDALQELRGPVAVLVEIEDALTPAFIVEELDDGRCVVLVPSVPTPAAGALYILTRDRIHWVDAPVTEAVAVLKQAELGMPAADMLRQGRDLEPTFHRWKKQYAGPESDQVRKLKPLRRERAVSHGRTRPSGRLSAGRAIFRIDVLQDRLVETRRVLEVSASGTMRHEVNNYENSCRMLYVLFFGAFLFATGSATTMRMSVVTPVIPSKDLATTHAMPRTRARAPTGKATPIAARKNATPNRKAAMIPATSGLAINRLND